jgi:hypothetical protein
VLVMGRRRRQRFVRRKVQRRMTAGHERDRKGIATAYKPIERDASVRRVTAQYGDAHLRKTDCAARTRGRPRSERARANASAEGREIVHAASPALPRSGGRAGSFL